MRKAKILISIFLTVLILYLCAITSFALGKNYSEDSESKISSKLLDMISNGDDDIIPVIIFLKSCDKKSVFQSLETKYGYDTVAYEDYNRYETEIVPNVKVDNKTVNDLLNGKEYSRDIISLDNEDSPIDISTRRQINAALVDNASTYLQRYREELLSNNRSYLNSFLEENEELIDCISLELEYAECIIADVRKENVSTLADRKTVVSIDYFENALLFSESWNAVPLTQSDSVDGLGSPSYNNGSGYDGTGIKIGIIEPECGRYDPNNYNLTDADITYVTNEALSDPVVVASHPTHVSSLVCGKKTNINGKVYEGVAKGGEVYQISIKNDEDFFYAIQKLILLGVKVINFSGGKLTGSGYSYTDKVIDRMISESGISFVVAAGNTGHLESIPYYGNVSSPAKGYNVISVGNLCTKAEPEDEEDEGNEAYNIALEAPYRLHFTSSKKASVLIANKPDVVAPGTNIFLPISSNEVEGIGTGTSYSAPIVTGMVAQLMQYNEYSIYNPNCAKNHVICGASNNDITDTNLLSTGALTNETGAGLVDAVSTYDHVVSGNRTYGAYLYTYSTPGEYTTKVALTLHRKKHFRAVVTFMKDEDSYITYAPYGNNIDMRLVKTDPNSTYYVDSESTNNNVELIDTYINTTLTYWLQIRFTNSILEQNGNTDLHYWISWREY